MRSVGEALVIMLAIDGSSKQDVTSTYFQLPVACLEQLLCHPRTFFAYGEFVVVAFFDDAAFV